jgi:hypothetical protein
MSAKPKQIVIPSEATNLLSSGAQDVPHKLAAPDPGL